MAEAFTEGQVQEFKEAFALFDRDGDNKISHQEFGTVFRALGQAPTESELRSILAESNPLLTFPEFLQLLAKHRKEPRDLERELRQALKVFDQEGTGYISAQELRHIITNVGDKLSLAEADELIQEAKPDAEGRISMESFVQMLLGK